MWPCKSVPGFLPATYSGAPYACCCSYPIEPVYMPWCPCCHPPHQESEGKEEKHSKCVPMEISADTAAPSKDAQVGGTKKVELTLEYTPDSGATAPTIKVVVTESDGSSEWNLTTVPAGYHVRSEFASVAPGAKITLQVSQCMARLRWFEQLS